MSCTRTEQIAQSHWRKFESDVDHAARVESALVDAGAAFNSVTLFQLNIHRQTMLDIRPYKGSPKWDRMKAEADRLWTDSTFPARELFFHTFEELMRDGEISEATSEKWDDLQASHDALGFKQLEATVTHAVALGVSFAQAAE